MFFKHIEIHNFRGIESLKINNIKQVNLITGKNNCGKTSVLEAVFLLTGMSNPQLTVNIHAFRDLLLTDDDNFSYLFKNFDFSQYPSITGQSSSQKRTLEIKAVYPTFTEISKQISEKRELSKEEFMSNASTNKKDSIEGLTLTFNINKKKNFQTEIKLKQGEIKLSRDYKEKLNASFINPKTIMNDLDQRLDAIVVKKDLGIIVNALKEIEPSLVDIRMGARGMVYADIGIDKLVPVNIMGDGIRRILAILAAISERKDGILLIDEIENGLHFSTLFVLWKAVLKTAFDNNIQLFITTHSYECIEAITRIYKNNTLNLEKDFITLFRIEKNNKGQHRAFQYETDTLLAGIEKEFEVR
ncbi:AAA family ATPase domain-containing protein [Desulfonema limicola]|uniref:AAA family ATPase domain-containing protein n=1 Tax=Desulfonema limicola TaxID=45656 RepID=A0A975BAR3_9BACT|nr:ATP-binding protein [Desulfonema limicola]QTA81968.1 AAA family ATPase domain-containing protein [Desulfonema limicola]